MEATEATVDLVRGYYALLDEGRFQECERFFAPDATMRIAHHPPIAGRKAILDVIRAGLSHPRVRGIRHDIMNIWEQEDGVVIFEVHVAYDLADAETTVVPGVVIADVNDGRFAAQRIAADLSPVYG